MEKRKPLDKRWLKLQAVAGRKQTEVSKETGWSCAHISRFAKKHNIKFDAYSKIRKTGKWDNLEWLKKQHWDLQRSIRNIAKEIDISSPRLLKRFRFYNIPIRNNTKATRLNSPILSQKLKKAWEDPSKRNKWLKARRRLWDNPEYVAKYSESMHAKWQNENYYQKMSLQSKKLHQNPEYIKKKLNGLRGCNHSVLEDVFAYFLDLIKINHNRHIIIGKGKQAREFDFKLEDNRLIEIDGWPHDMFSISKANDIYKNNLCKQLNYKLTRIHWEIFDSINLFNELCKSIDYDYITQKIDIKSIKIERSTTKECKDFFRLFHYLHNCGRYGRTYKFIINNEPIAMIICGSVIRKEAATSLGKDPKDVIEIIRYARNPMFYNKNLGSWALSQIIKEYKNKTIIAFADPAVGHTGSIYKAANFEQVGTQSVDYWYENQNGLIIHKKTLYNRAKKEKMKESEYAIQHNCKRYYYPGKLKFVRWKK